MATKLSQSRFDILDLSILTGPSLEGLTRRPDVVLYMPSAPVDPLRIEMSRRLVAAA